MRYFAEKLAKFWGVGDFQPSGKKAEKWPSKNNGPIAVLDKNEAEKIVNEYGKALEKTNWINRKNVLHLVERIEYDEKLREEVEQQLAKKSGAYFDLFSQKASESLLPYPKEQIKAAIDLLLKYEKAPQNIALLRAGLEYLKHFS